MSERLRLKQIEEKLDALTRAIEASDMISEEEAAKLLNRKPRTLYKNTRNGLIPPSAYTIGMAGQRFYRKSHLIGLN